MSIVYLLKNQHHHFLERSGEWVHPDASKALFRTEHKDEAINQKVELSVKFPELRLTLIEASLDEQSKLHIAEQHKPIAALHPSADAVAVTSASNDTDSEDLFQPASARAQA